MTRLSRNRLSWCLAILFAIGFLALVGRLYELSLGPSYSDGGTDFGVEGTAARVAFSFHPKKLAPGDSLSLDITLGDVPGTTPGVLPPGIANETDGVLSGVLMAPDDCKVTPQNRTDWPTSGQTLAEMQWHWIVDCATEGRKTLSPIISFTKNPGWTAPPDGDRTDATPYRGTLSIDESKPLTQVLLGFLSAVFLAVVGTLVTFLLRQRSPSSQ